MIIGIILLAIIIFYYVFIRPANGDARLLIWGGFFILLYLLYKLGVNVYLSIALAVIMVIYMTIRFMLKLNKNEE